MGGSAFSPELHTPRMPPEVYVYMRERILKTLRVHYKHVECPIEAPAKADYGDIDVLACEPFETQNKLSDDGIIGKLLRAKLWKRDRGSDEVQFALPWPNLSKDNTVSRVVPEVGTTSRALDKQLAQLSRSDAKTTSPGLPGMQQDKFVQLDLHICSNKSIYDWQLFRCAHGDFWIIIGSMIRRYGLSFRNSALYVRIAGVEKVNKKLSLVQLSDDPSEVLRFLFKESIKNTYWKRDAFESVEEMCDFIRLHCKFYRPMREEEKVQDEEGVELEVQKKERSRLIKRGNFSYWLDEYLPAHSSANHEAGVKGEYAGMSREEVAEMVKEHFGVKKEYDDTQKTGLRQLGVEKVWADVRASIPLVEKNLESTQGLEVNFIVRTLRRKLSVEARDKTRNELDDVQVAYREGRFDEVKEWTEANWKEAAERKRVENEKSHVHFKER